MPHFRLRLNRGRRLTLQDADTQHPGCRLPVLSSSRVYLPHGPYRFLQQPEPPARGHVRLPHGGLRRCRDYAFQPFLMISVLLWRQGRHRPGIRIPRSRYSVRLPPAVVPLMQPPVVCLHSCWPEPLLPHSQFLSDPYSPTPLSVTRCGDLFMKNHLTFHNGLIHNADDAEIDR